MLAVNTADLGQNPIYQYRPVVAPFFGGGGGEGGEWKEDSDKRTEFLQFSQLLLLVYDLDEWLTTNPSRSLSAMDTGTLSDYD